MTDVSSWGPADYLAVAFCFLIGWNTLWPIVAALAGWLFGCIELLALKAYNLGNGRKDVP